MDIQTERTNSPLLIALLGPTATGKSALALSLATYLDAEIISVDSVQVYKAFDIGSAKASAQEQKSVPHHLLDQVHFWEPYSVGSFVVACKKAITLIHQKNKPVILCGGTMLYYRALLLGLSDLPPSDPDIRKELLQQWENNPKSILSALEKRDPESYARLHPHDRQRIIRALEVTYLHKATLSMHYQQSPPQPTICPDISIGLLPQERTWLHAKIQKRLDNMLETGFLEELQKIVDQAQPPYTHSALQAVGYRQFLLYIQGQVTYAEAYTNTLVATRRLAKRQMTWMRSLPIDVIEHVPHASLVERCIGHIEKVRR